MRQHYTINVYSRFVKDILICIAIGFIIVVLGLPMFFKVFVPDPITKWNKTHKEKIQP